MKHKTKYFALCLILFVISSISSSLSAGTYTSVYNETDTTLVSADGPYVWYQEDGSARIITVNLKGELKDTTYQTLPEDFVLPVTSSDGAFRFQVPLRPVQRPSWKYKQPKKAFVMSDPHGRLDYVVSLFKETVSSTKS